MPLASSLSSTQKRAAAVQAEKEEQERRQRLSLPRSCRSSTRVTKDSAKRRRNSRAMSEERSKKQSRSSDGDSTKENVGSPSKKASKPADGVPVLSPTPYWKVAQERRGSKKFSPPMTRSAKKPPRHSGVTLAFSPPDQEANKRREQEEQEAKQRDREQRISEAQRNGQLLVFSPNSLFCRNFNMDDDDGEVPKQQGDEEDEEQSVTSNHSYKSQTSGLTSSHQSQSQAQSQMQIDYEMKEDIRGIKATLEMVAKDRARLSDAGLMQQTQDKMALETERLKTETLQSANTKLEATVTELQSKLAENKEGFSVEMARLKTESESANREHSLQIQGLEEDVARLKKEKLALMDQIKSLEEDLNQTKEMLSENENDTEAIAEMMQQIEQLKSKEADTDREKSAMETELNEMKNVRLQLEEKVQNYEEELETLKTSVTGSDSQLQAALDKMQSLEAASKKEIQDRESTISDLMERINVLRAEKQEAQKIEEANKELHAQLEQLKSSMKEKEQSISDLKNVLRDAQQKEEQNRLTFVNEKNGAQQSIAELELALQSSAEKLRIAKENEEQQAGEARQKGERILELERQLRDTRSRLQDTEHRLGTSDERENELIRRLQESDKIRVALHNRVTQLSGSIRVFVRVRPMIPGEEEKAMAAFVEKEKNKRKRKAPPAQMENPFRFPGELDSRASSDPSDDITKRIVEMKEPSQDRGGLSDRRKVWRFPFDNVFSPNSSQEDVWSATAPLVQSAIDGYPVCIFAYGQTGSGKTYSMLGEGEGEKRGIIARAVDKMFASKKEMEELSRGSTNCEISVELLEVYNENVRDLLAPNSGPNGKEIPSLKVTSNEVVGNIVCPASSVSEVMNILNLAQSRRCVKATNSNAESSRSHMIFTLHMKVKSKDGMAREGKLNVVDLAGSERLSKSGANTIVKGDLLRETKAINSSLSVLSNVIEKLQEGSKNVPYRESTLTWLLKESLSGNSKTLAIVCCNPLGTHFHESLCSLRFAHKVGKVELKSFANFSC